MNIYKKIYKDFEKIFIRYISKKKYDPIVRQSKNEKWDYQINGVMKLSKIININPIKLAKKIVKLININNMYKSFEISHPGFINILIDKHWISKKLDVMIFSKKLNIKYKSKKNIVIDYSSPNVAKEMHVGHLRSTIIGDVSARVLKFLGHNVIKNNHIGDWGSQFGMIIFYLKNKSYNIEKIKLKKLEKIYKKSKIMYSKNKNFYDKSNKYLYKLQSGDLFCHKIWKKIVNITMQENIKIYKILNVTLSDKHTIGESKYKNMLPGIIKDLQLKKISIKKNNEIFVVLDNIKNKKGKPMGIKIRTKHKTYLYTTIDIACIKHRCKTLKADRIIYYTDVRQKQHLKSIFTIAKKAGYITKNTKIEHHMFGMMLNKKGLPFKTRNGNNIKLSVLIKKCFEKCKKILKNKNYKLSDYKINKISLKIAIGSLKYYDLSKKRINNYIFSWKDMLNINGNTSSYIQYAYMRIYSILKKTENINFYLKKKMKLKKIEEIKLGLKILQFEEILLLVAKNGTPHVICKYLYQLSNIFSNFYEKHPILNSLHNEVNIYRLKLIILTSKVLKTGLQMLGINILKKM
ncbi:arginine--tRNA ligase [Buchnera aphidicola (Taiwanaphis decaspermi)]|uniref:arginine--tRNA ligase n=1 Tax=Buchnera aphidicola TaxID=9 RepID=UPI0031B8B126